MATPTATLSATAALNNTFVITVSPDAELLVAPPHAGLVAVHVALPLPHAAGVPPLFPPEPPVDKPVKHSVHAIHGATTRDRCPRPASDRSIGVRYQALIAPGLRYIP
jgi:hypothetical protein